MELASYDWNNPPKQRSIEEQINSLNKEERECFDELRSFWDNDKMDVKYDDFQILRFARCSPGKLKFNVNQSKKTMMNYAAWSKRFDLSKINISTIRHDFEKNCLFMPGIRDVDGNHVVCIRTAVFIPGKDSLDGFIRSLVYVLDAITHFEDACTNGICFVTSHEGWGWANFSVKTATTIMNTLQGNFPIRLRKLAIFDSPSWIGTALKIVRPILTADFQSKFKFLKRSQLLEVFRSIEETPDFLGGKLDTKERNKEFVLHRYEVEGLDPKAPYHSVDASEESSHE